MGSEQTCKDLIVRIKTKPQFVILREKTQIPPLTILFEKDSYEVGSTGSIAFISYIGCY